MSTMTENGTHVTRAEMLAHLEPMRADIAETKKDVKTLLAFAAGDVAVTSYKRWLVGAGLTIAALVGTVLGVVFG